MDSIGDIIHNLDVKLQGPALTDNQHVVEALVIMKIKDLEGPVAEAHLRIADSRLDWIQRRGLLGSLEDVLRAEPFTDTTED